MFDDNQGRQLGDDDVDDDNGFDDGDDYCDDNHVGMYLTHYNVKIIE